MEKERKRLKKNKLEIEKLEGEVEAHQEAHERAKAITEACDIETKKAREQLKKLESDLKLHRQTQIGI
ncbi:MAG: hypothetical protein ACTSUE_13605 [Promethearchaeota archaeon]